MPTIATRGGASARGFGFSGIKTNVTSQTFTSSTTWVAPAGVTNLLAIIGKGQDGQGDYEGGLLVAEVEIASEFGGAGPYPLPITADAAKSTAQLCADTFNAGGYQSASVAMNRYFRFYSSQTYSWTDFYPYGTGAFPYYLIADTWSVGGSPASGNLFYPTNGSYAAVGNAILPGNAGADTTGFGYTFIGGDIDGTYPDTVGYPAPVISDTNVPVTPGASYPLSIPAGGYITIQYLT